MFDGEQVEWVLWMLAMMPHELYHSCMYTRGAFWHVLPQKPLYFESNTTANIYVRPMHLLTTHTSTHTQHTSAHATQHIDTLVGRRCNTAQASHPASSSRTSVVWPQ